MIILTKQQQINLWDIIPKYGVLPNVAYMTTWLKDYIRAKYKGDLHTDGTGWIIRFDDPKHETRFRLEVLCSL